MAQECDVNTFQSCKRTSDGRVHKRFQALLLTLALTIVGIPAAHACCGTPPPVAVGIPVVTLPCSTCASYADLQTAGQAFFTKWQWLRPTGYITSNQVVVATNAGRGVGTLLVVVSTANPISASMRFSASGSVITAVAVSTPSDLGAATLDGKMFARATKMPPITMPPSYKPSDAPELWSSYIDGNVLIQTPKLPALDPWHFITNFPQILFATFLNTQTGQLYTVFNNDPITIQFSNGWTVQVQWKANSTIRWAVVPGTLRDQNGHVVSSNIVQSNVNASGTVSITDPTAPLGFTINLVANTGPINSSDPTPSCTVELLGSASGGGGGGGTTILEDVEPD